MIARAREFYSRRFDIPYPNESWPVGRPLKTTPLYGLQLAKNAIFTATFGVEVPAYFAPEGEKPEEIPTFYRSNAFPIIAEECRAAHEKVGVIEISAVAKFIVHGDDAERFLRHVVASPLPAVGKALPGLLLSATGKLIGDLNVALLEPDRYLVTGPTFMQAIYLRWFEQQKTGFAVTIDNASDTLGALFLVGPKSAALLDKLTDHYAIGSLLAEGDLVETAVGFAPCHVVRSDRLGPVGFEIYTPMPYLHALYQSLMVAGIEFGIRDIGLRAYSALIMERTPGVTLREISQDHTVAECGYEHLLAHDRQDFIGCKPAFAALHEKPKYQLAGLRVDAKDADPIGDEPVWIGDKYVGHTSSGNYGHTVGYALAMAFLEDAAFAEGVELEVSILGERRPARVVPTPFLKA